MRERERKLLFIIFLYIMENGIQTKITVCKNKFKSRKKPCVVCLINLGLPIKLFYYKKCLSNIITQKIHFSKILILINQ